MRTSSTPLLHPYCIDTQYTKFSSKLLPWTVRDTGCASNFFIFNFYSTNKGLRCNASNFFHSNLENPQATDCTTSLMLSTGDLSPAITGVNGGPFLIVYSGL